MSRVGLVTTFRFAAFAADDEGYAGVERCWSTLSSFLLFHLAKGVEHVFLYADADDGSNDVYIENVGRDFSACQVSVDVRNESQRERQRSNCRLWNELGSFSDTEVPARQSLNAEDSMRRAGELGLDWLLHLDVDELFYTSEVSIQAHFERLNKLGVEQMTYANHEAVPTREEVKDYFREVDLFRVNHLVLPLSRPIGEGTRFWRRRRNHGQYMLAYDNGKAAVRVLPEKIVPQSVHRWRTLKSGERGYPAVEGGGCGNGVDTLCGEEPGDEAGESAARSFGVGGGRGENASKPTSGDQRAQLVNRTAMADPRELRFDELLECTDPCVLHYPSCGLDWLRDKYRMLGSFPSSWFGGKLPIAPCFHLDARNAMGDTASRDRLAREDAEGDGGRELYRKEVMLCPDEFSEEIRLQLGHGVLRVITGPASVIETTQNARGSARSMVTPATTSARAASQAVGTVAGKAGSGEDACTSVGEAAPVDGGESGEQSSSMELNAAGDDQLPTVGSEGSALAGGEAASGVDNSWILAACAREFL